MRYVTFTTFLKAEHFLDVLDRILHKRRFKKRLYRTDSNILSEGILYLRMLNMQNDRLDLSTIPYIIYSKDIMQKDG
jgi:hypothetical protein